MAKRPVRVGYGQRLSALAMAILSLQPRLQIQDLTLENDPPSSVTPCMGRQQYTWATTHYVDGDVCCAQLRNREDLHTAATDKYSVVAVTVEGRGNSVDSCRRPARCIGGRRPGTGGQHHQDTRFAPPEIEPGGETGNRPAVRRHQHVDIGDLRAAGHWGVIPVPHHPTPGTPSTRTDCTLGVGWYSYPARACTGQDSESFVQRWTPSRIETGDQRRR